jgi:hypothetical protein
MCVAEDILCEPGRYLALLISLIAFVRFFKPYLLSVRLPPFRRGSQSAIRPVQLNGTDTVFRAGFAERNTVSVPRPVQVHLVQGRRFAQSLENRPHGGAGLAVSLYLLLEKTNSVSPAPSRSSRSRLNIQASTCPTSSSRVINDSCDGAWYLPSPCWKRRWPIPPQPLADWAASLS